MKKRKEIAELYDEKNGKMDVLQGNIAFAIGAARTGFHAADGYPGTPSTEVIDKGLAHLPENCDMIVGWSVSEAVALGVAFGHSIAGSDTICTMKIPGLMQAGDVFSSIAWYTQERGALVLYLASDYHPSSTQHVMDARPVLMSCSMPIFEPGNYQEMLESGKIARQISKEYNTPCVVLASGILCHSEGLIKLNKKQTIEKMPPPEDYEKYFNNFFNLPNIARLNYNEVMKKRMPELLDFSEHTELNKLRWGNKRVGIVSSGINRLYVKEVCDVLEIHPSTLEIGFYPLPLDKMKEFAKAVEDEIYVFEDGKDVIQQEFEKMGVKVIGKDRYDPRTEWTPKMIAKALGTEFDEQPIHISPVKRPPSLCPGCPYRAFGKAVETLKKKKKLDAVFGDIGCNTLLHFLRAMDTVVCMGASDSVRQGSVLSRPELTHRTISVLGESTECHSGKDATRNAVFRNIPGVKVVLNNLCTAMTGAQPDPASPMNLDGEPNQFDLVESLKGEGCKVVNINAYDTDAVSDSLKEALEDAEKGVFTALILEANCLQIVPGKQKKRQYQIDEEKCIKCHRCLICPGIAADGKGEVPYFTHICTGCGGHVPSLCAQMCPVDAIELIEQEEEKIARELDIEIPEFDLPAKPKKLPEIMRIGVRGVGGQGNLFVGKVLGKLALNLGYDDQKDKNILKGETHGMAQLGGPVISTLAVGKVHSPTFLPKTADILIALEASEVLRDGFLEMLKEDGTILLNLERRIPPGMDPEEYPEIDDIRKELDGYNVIEFDALEECKKAGDTEGRFVNVVTLGLLSTIPPFRRFAIEYWWKALMDCSPTDFLKKANFAAFNAGRKLRETLEK